MKSCPFCGGNNLASESRIPVWGSRLKEFHIVCNDCASSAPIYVWNLRAKKDALNLENKKSGDTVNDLMPVT